MLSNITITNLHYRSLQVCFEAARQSLSSSQILWQQQLGFSRPAAGWIHPAARDYISAAPTSPVASHFLLRPIRGDLRPTRGDLSNERGFHQIVGTRESWSSRRQQTKQHFFLLYKISNYFKRVNYWIRSPPTRVCIHFENCVRQFPKTSWWKIVENFYHWLLTFPHQLLLDKIV